MFQKSILVPGRVIIFGAIWAQTPFFGLFYLKSYDDEIWYVGTLCDLRPKAELFARRRRALCPGAKRLCYCPPYAGFSSAERTKAERFARRMRVFVRARNALSVLLPAGVGFSFGRAQGTCTIDD